MKKGLFYFFIFSIWWWKCILHKHSDMLINFSFFFLISLIPYVNRFCCLMQWVDIVVCISQLMLISYGHCLEIITYSTSDQSMGVSKIGSIKKSIMRIVYSSVGLNRFFFFFLMFIIIFNDDDIEKRTSHGQKKEQKRTI